MIAVEPTRSEALLNHLQQMEIPAVKIGSVQSRENTTFIRVR
jgi:hypothetical protein